MEVGIVDFFDKGALLVYIVIVIIEFALLINTMFSTLYMWQVKEYRFDRYIVQIKKALTNWKLIVIFFLKLVLLFVFFSEIVSREAFVVLALFALAAEAIYLVIEVINKSIKRPKFKSIRNLIIIFFNLIITFTIILIPLYSIILFVSLFTGVTSVMSTITVVDIIIVAVLPWLLLDILSGLVIATLVLLTSPIAWLKRTRIKRQGQEVLAAAKDIKTIGITGSYGKTTTKELLYQVLSKKYKVAKTPEHYNTAVGISMAIKDSVKQDTEIFIAEMGAYKIGEIKESTDIVPLDVAIVTGIEGQHLSLFGSMENLVNTKFEIIQGLKDDKGVAILNGDNEYCIQMAGRTNHKKVLYFSIDETNKIASGNNETEPTESEQSKMYKFAHDKNIYATNIQTKSNGINFKLSFSGVIYDIATNIIGAHNVLNLLAVISACVTIGMEVDEVVKIINGTEFVFPYLNSQKALNDSTLIDDGYNVSHKGFIAGLDYLKTLKTQNLKWVMTQGLIELGVEKDTVYKDIAKEISNIANGLITNDRDLIEEVKSLNKEVKLLEVANIKEFDKIYKENVSAGDLVLLEGAFPDSIVTKILIDK